METTNRQQGAALPNPVGAPTMEDFSRALADGMQRTGTVTASNGLMLDDETAATTLQTLAGLSTALPKTSHAELAELLEVINAYGISACTPEEQSKAQRAHKTLMAIIRLYYAAKGMRGELNALAKAAAAYRTAQKAYKRAQRAAQKQND